MKFLAISKKSNFEIQLKCMKLLLTSIFYFTLSILLGQSSSLTGILQDNEGEAIIFSNVVLYNSDKTQLVKVETTNEDGQFTFTNIVPGSYILTASYIGYGDINKNVELLDGDDQDLGLLIFQSKGIELETAVVTAQRAMVEVKPDKTVFNVEGTINSAGDNGLGLLRKAPGVLVDNNNNVMVLGRSGMLFYIDGKRLPLSGEELTNYLLNIPAEQIDRIDIISNPGARYEAEGNAGIIDIILKKQKNTGYNAKLNSNVTRGRRTRANLNLSGNYRNQKFNAFGTLGYSYNQNWNRMFFDNFQNTLFMKESNVIYNDFWGSNYRIGTDFFLSDNHTLGFIISGGDTDLKTDVENRIQISNISTPTQLDSVLFADNVASGVRNQNTYNLNYVFKKADNRLNFDLDYGRYDNETYWDQPNLYFTDLNQTQALSEVITNYNTPVEINIYTAKIDFEKEALGGKIGIGSKYSNVDTDNTFLFYDVLNDQSIQNNQRSNRFEYSEKVIAGYLSYARKLNDKWNMISGLRVEKTNSNGYLTAFDPNLQEDPVIQDYVNFFPSGGLTYIHKPNKTYTLNFGRRINRPNYNVLNPFRTQLSEISFEKGNEKLSPEIVNNVELGYTFNYRYNFKLAYSYTTNQITRLIAPDKTDLRASFITWENLAEQTVINFNISAPFTVSQKWSLFLNLNASHIDNQADYSDGDGGIVDIQVFTYSIFQQSTFDLGKGFKGEISGWFGGPGVWGGVFKYDSSYSLNLGLQKKYDRLSFKLSAQDVTFQSGWSGASEFNGLRGEGRGNWDSRTVGLSISYDFGNSKIKASRKRKTGMESESGRVNNG